MLLTPIVLKPCTPAGESQLPFLLTWSGRPREVVQCPGDNLPCSCRGRYFLSETPRAVLVLLSRGPGGSGQTSQWCFPRLLQHECHVRSHGFTFLQQKHFPMARLPREGVVFLNDLRRGSSIFYRKCPQTYVAILCLGWTHLRLTFFLNRADGALPEHIAPISARAWESQFYTLNMEWFSPIPLLSKASSLCENVFVKNPNFEAYRDWNTEYHHIILSL